MALLFVFAVIFGTLCLVVIGVPLWLHALDVVTKFWGF